MGHQGHANPRALLALTASAALISAAAATTPLTASAATARAGAQRDTSCHLRHGVKHVVNILFDNVHFTRDNPNVKSDLEQMPHLYRFLKRHGTVFSNTHTPLIAHTADDSLSIYTGLYGDRHGQPLTNSYQTYNPDGTVDNASSFAYWTDPVYDTSNPPSPGHDSTPTMVYSPRTPAKSGATSRQTPAPWVPFTRAGCSVGDFSTANMVLENTKADLPNVFGPNSPEVQQYNTDPDSYKDAETTQYVGVAVHCAKSDPICTTAKGQRGNQTTVSPTAVPDRLPTEPGGYHGFKALYGARYTAPQLGAGKPNVFHHGYRVTDSNGNLVDMFGNAIMNEYSHSPGFPGFDPTAAQSLAYAADMQEAGIPVTYAYIADLHEVLPGDQNCTSAGAAGNYDAIGPGDRCYAQNTRAYDKAFAKFFKRLRADGITPKNTIFEIGAEENDQFAGANAHRQLKPTPADCTGLPGNRCHYPAGTMGELAVNMDAELAGTRSAGTAFDLQPQGASIYVHGNPGPNAERVRQMERDTARMRSDNAYSGAQHQRIVKYQAGRLEQRVLHMRTADPLREPTYTMFPVPDYYFGRGDPNATDPVTIDSAYAWNHGYYSPNIDIIWSSFVGPGVAHRGVDGPSPRRGSEATDPNSTRTVPQASRTGTWVEETDIRPTLLWLTGLRDDYPSDGEVISQALRHPTRAMRAVRELARVYQQLNSSVGRFATNTLIADTKALRSGTSSDDSVYAREQARLRTLAGHRDRWANRSKTLLRRADHGRMPSESAIRQAIRHDQHLIARSGQLRRTTG